jgi:hypothetical protein
MRKIILAISEYVDTDDITIVSDNDRIVYYLYCESFDSNFDESRCAEYFVKYPQAHEMFRRALMYVISDPSSVNFSDDDKMRLQEIVDVVFACK